VSTNGSVESAAMARLELFHMDRLSFHPFFGASCHVPRGRVSVSAGCSSTVCMSSLSERAEIPTTAGISRRAVLRLAVLSVIYSSTPDASAQPRAEGLTPEDAVLPVAMCMHVLEPMHRYITAGAWDKARTNVNYCTRVLAIRKKMHTAAEILVDDAFYDGTEFAEELINILTQLDASVYTPIFIASEDGVSPEQRKYQKEAFLFLEEAQSYLNKFMALFPENAVSAAKEAAKSGKLYEIRVESP
jgi:hypothetical protein